MLTWTKDTADTVLPPASTSVIAKVSTSANAYISFQGLATSMTVAASDSQDGSFTPTYNYGSYSSAQCGGSGTHYIAIDNAAANTVLTMTAISGSASSGGSGYNPGGYGSVGVGVTATPVTINPVGATPDGQGGWGILIGQHCSPKIFGIPTDPGWSATYAWSVSGTTFQSWTVSSDHKTTTEVDGPGQTNVESPSWYWNDLNAKDETISCTATVTPPAGEGSPFTVTASELVSVFVPFWTATGTGGYVKVNLPPNTTNYNQYEIYAGATIPMENAGQLGGMNIKASVLSPAPALFADGTLELVQIITPREGWSIYNGIDVTPHFPPDYGQRGLDGAYPYGWITNSGPPAPTYTTDDAPGFSLLDYSMISATLKHDFEDYLMYMAPGSQQPVPVARFIWNYDGSAGIPSTSLWKDFAKEHNGSDAVGTVTPSGNVSTFLEFNEFPVWTQID